VTDANLVLNRLNPDAFFGGRLHLERDAAERAIEEHVARPLGMSLVEAATGIVDIVDNLMADLVRRMTTERGHDLRDFALYAFGGGGPLHVGSYAAAIGVETAVIPTGAAVFSALGIAKADAKHFARVSAPAVMPIDPDAANERFASLAARGAAALESSGFPLRHEFTIAMRFRNQTHEVAVPVPSMPLTAEAVAELHERFYAVYEARYGSGTALRDTTVEAVTYEVVTVAAVHLADFEEVEPNGLEVDDAFIETRRVYFGGEAHDTAAFDGALLQPGHELDGPALVEGATTTVPVHPGQRLTVDRLGNLVLGFGVKERGRADELAVGVDD
jgi:N-methylhydantoinase A